jgi:hypothetical protein
MSLTPEQRAENLAFLEKIVRTHGEAVLQLMEPLARMAGDYEIRQLVGAVTQREEFRCWGQADPPFTREDVALLRQRAGSLDAAAATYNYPDAQPFREGRSAEVFANEANDWRNIADRIEAMLRDDE